MAVSPEAKADFAQKSKAIKVTIKASLDKEKNIITIMKNDNSGVEYKKILLAEEMIYIATLYIAINTLSVSILGIRNQDALNDARKAIYKAIIYLEEIVSSTVDCPYSEIAPRLENISNMPIEKRFYLVRKLGLVITMLFDSFGDNTKWKWSFVELRGRYATVAKNLIDMKQASKDYFDISSHDYDNTVLYVRLIRSLLAKTIDDFRDKYEISTRSAEDMQKAINFTIANRRIAVLLGDIEEAEELKKKAAALKTRMDEDKRKGLAK